MSIREVPFMECGPLDPGNHGAVTVRNGWDGDARKYRVIGVRATAVFRQSWLARLARRIPGVPWILRRRDAAARDHATSLVQVERIDVDNWPTHPHKCEDLPEVAAGSEIVVYVTNTSNQPITVQVVVEGRLS